MSTEQILRMVKIDLGLTTTVYDGRIAQFIQAAEKEIVREGAVLNPEDIDHANIVAMYAGWMWRRRDTGEGMPRMLRYALNNLVFSQKMAGGE